MNRLRLLFLDFDGVLNSIDWMKRRPAKEDWANQLGLSEESDNNHSYWALRSIDPDAVSALNRLLALTSARVVVSSSWRSMWPLPKLEWMLRWHGFDHHLLGTTPLGVTLRPKDEPWSPTLRGAEIERWLTMMFGHPLPKWLDFVILDDDSDMAPFEEKLFQTSHDTGLRDEHVDVIARMYHAYPVLAQGARK